MERFTARSTFPAPRHDLFAWHERSGAFERLAPPWERMRILQSSGGIRDGATLTFAMKKGPLWLKWAARHSGYIENQQFIDEQASGPFAYWKHTHAFSETPHEGRPGAMLEDRVEFRLPMGAVGRRLGGDMNRRVLERLFSFRHARTRADLSRSAEFREALGGRSARVAVSGASGAIGSRLTSFLTVSGHDVVRLVRRPAGAGEVFWQPGPGPKGGQIGAEGLEDCDAIVHLAGEGLNGRWTDQKKEQIAASRVEGTRLIARAAAELARPPRVLIVASGVHYYGDRAEQELTEDAGVGSGFLAGVCREWEHAAEPARQAGIRVVHLRIGMVLSTRGGALPAMLPFFKLGLGAVPGPGTQWWSWISMEDAVLAILRSITSPLEGALNVIAPGPVTAHEFASTLARVLDRPVGMRITPGVLRSLVGEKADAVLSSTRAVPDRLRRDGHRFVHHTLEAALRWELGLISPEEAGVHIEWQ
jgi:uncharacterized protein (TIGR01777 family)